MGKRVWGRGTKEILLFLLVVFIFSFSVFSSQIISEHAYGVAKDGNFVFGNITITVYDKSMNQIYSEKFIDAIFNGSFGVQLGLYGNLTLYYGEDYYKDYFINGEDVNFTLSNGSTVDRMPFISNVGLIRSDYINESALNLSKSFLNWSYISNVPSELSDGDDDYCFGGTCSGDLVVSGNLTVLGNYINATVENQYINGSFEPTINNTFDLGSNVSIWRRIFGFLDWNFLINVPVLQILL